MLKNKIEERLKLLEGNYGIYYANLTKNDDFFVGNTNDFIAAGIIKLFILIEAIRHTHENLTPDNQTFILKDSDKVPSIGALSGMHDGLELHFSDLYTLMLSVSDNTAANMLIDYLEIKKINKTLDSLGIHGCSIKRKFFDQEAINQGFENIFSLREIGKLLGKLYKGEVFSKKSSNKILELLKMQQRDYVMSHHFKEKIDVAHQMGEEDEKGITHDVGIIFGDDPFILCIATQNVNSTIAQGIMRDITLICYNHN